MTSGPHSLSKPKNTPVTPKTVAATTGSVREWWLESIYKEIENFLLNMAITDADPALVVKFKAMGKWPLPCQMLFVLEPLTQVQHKEVDSEEAYKATKLGCTIVAAHAEPSICRRYDMVRRRYYECIPQC